MSASRRIGTILTVTAVGSVSILATAWLYRSVKEYGWEGTLRLIWEGDHYAPDVRDALDQLENLETQTAVRASLLELIETSLARAELNTIDDDQSVKKEGWATAHLPENLEKDLAKLSYDLDRLAAKVDTVLTKHADVRPKKKELSRVLVKLMERADELLKIYQKKEKSTAAISPSS